ncbi:hypothetical protein G7Y89_g13436 [Cudoniella acicularis]|uniref:Uncharacterized protein n=1 Tax=Cudoniella acicularis TaxID=354080 RepID=A0A8H4VW24_9HELO|nr:hypothetical protein G7Y89_g13436 [Cudoniella acicularis]
MPGSRWIGGAFHKITEESPPLPFWIGDVTLKHREAGATNPKAVHRMFMQGPSAARLPVNSKSRRAANRLHESTDDGGDIRGSFANLRLLRRLESFKKDPKIMREVVSVLRVLEHANVRSGGECLGSQPRCGTRVGSTITEGFHDPEAKW